MTDEQIKKIATILSESILKGFDKIPEYKWDDRTDSRVKVDRGAELSEILKRQLDDNKAIRENNRLNEINKLEEEAKRLRDAIASGKIKDTKYTRDLERKNTTARERLENGGWSKEDERKFKHEQWSKIGKIVQGGLDIVIAVWTYTIEKERALSEYNSKIIQVNLEKQTKIVNSGMKSITTGFTKNAIEVAYDFVGASYDISRTAATSSMKLDIAQQTFAKTTQAATTNMVNGIGSAIMGVGGAIAALAGWTGVGAAIGGVVAGLGFIAQGIAKISQMDIAEQELAIMQGEKALEITEQYLNTFETITKDWDKLAKESTDFVLKINDAATKFAVTIGYAGGDFTDKLGHTVIGMSQSIMANGQTMAQVFGKEVEKIPEYMNSFMEASQRNVMLSSQDMGNIMATGRLFGMSGAEASNLYGSMNIFNTSVSSAADSMGVMYHQLTRMGLSSKKFGKDLIENLKLAQKYNFKGGVDNMMKLTKWAQQTRFNLNSAASFADKIFSGSLSDALEASAKLQVLGGARAIYSDPLGMLFDAGADVENLAKRQLAMLSDFGSFNYNTGETQFNDWYENKMIAETAKALNMSVEEARNVIRQNKKQGVIDRVLGDKLSEEDRLAIGNRATYNKKEGKWEVVDVRGEKHDIMDYVNGNAKIDDLLPADTQEAMLEVAQKSLSHQENLDNAVTWYMTKLGYEKEKKILDTSDDKLKTLDKFFTNNWSGIMNMWEDANQYSLDVFERGYKLMEESITYSETIQNVYAGNLRTLDRLINNLGSDIKDASTAWKTGVLGSYSNAKVTGSSIESVLRWANLVNVIENKTLSDLNKEFKPVINEESFYNQSESTRVVNKTKDISGYTNGGVITGASHVKSINDGAVNIKTASTDQYLAAMPNGPIDKILQQLIPGMQALIKANSGSGSTNDININFGGKIDLSENGSNINLVEILKNNPTEANKFVSMLLRAVETSINGKSVNNYKL